MSPGVLTSAGRMGCKQAAHLGANVLQQRQKSGVREANVSSEEVEQTGSGWTRWTDVSDEDECGLDEVITTEI